MNQAELHAKLAAEMRAKAQREVSEAQLIKENAGLYGAVLAQQMLMGLQGTAQGDDGF
jgi:hypothetical protein